MAYCPTCGGKVDPRRLPSEIELAELSDRIKVEATVGRLFIALFDAGGRTLTQDQCMDLLEMWGKEPSYGNICTKIKRLRKAVADMPCEIETYNKVGWRMTRPVGWHWRDLPVREPDEFKLK